MVIESKQGVVCSFYLSVSLHFRGMNGGGNGRLFRCAGDAMKLRRIPWDVSRMSIFSEVLCEGKRCGAFAPGEYIYISWLALDCFHNEIANKTCEMSLVKRP